MQGTAFQNFLPRLCLASACVENPGTGTGEATRVPCKAQPEHPTPRAHDWKESQMEVNTFGTWSDAAVHRIARAAVASLWLSLLGVVGAARADDVTVQPAPGSGFVVTDNTGASQRFKVLESGPIFL